MLNASNLTQLQKRSAYAALAFPLLLLLSASPSEARQNRGASCAKPQASVNNLYRSTWEPPFCSALRDRIGGILAGMSESKSSKVTKEATALISALQKQSLLVAKSGWFDPAKAEMAAGIRVGEETSESSSGKRKKKTVTRRQHKVLHVPLFIGGGDAKQRKAAYLARQYRTEDLRLAVACSETDTQRTCRVASISLGSKGGTSRSACGFLQGYEVSKEKKGAPKVKKGPSGSGLASVYGGTSIIKDGQSLKLPTTGEIGYARYIAPFKKSIRFVQPNGTPGKHGKLAMVFGRGSEYGGSGDKGVTRSETGSGSGTNLKQMKGFECALRMDDGPNHERRQARNGQKVIITNPTTGRSAVCVIGDWGPNPTKAHANNKYVDLSPATIDYLNTPAGASYKYDAKKSVIYKGRTMANVGVAFARPDAALGPIQ
jgi:hypothetical protein